MEREEVQIIKCGKSVETFEVYQVVLFTNPRIVREIVKNPTSCYSDCLEIPCLESPLPSYIIANIILIFDLEKCQKDNVT